MAPREDPVARIREVGQAAALRILGIGSGFTLVFCFRACSALLFAACALSRVLYPTALNTVSFNYICSIPIVISINVNGSTVNFTVLPGRLHHIL